MGECAVCGRSVPAERVERIVLRAPEIADGIVAGIVACEDCRLDVPGNQNPETTYKQFLIDALSDRVRGGSESLAEWSE